MSDQQVSASRVIDASAEVIFDIIADPSRHADFDGSGTVRTARTSERLEMDAKFAMFMKLGVPYVIGNTVVEFEENKRIAWRHMGHHRWRYELSAAEGGGTLVTETFDWSKSRFPKFIELAGYPKKHPANMEKTLERLDKLATGS